MHRFLAIISSSGSDESKRWIAHIEAELSTSSSSWSNAYRSAGAAIFHTGVRPGSADVYRLHGGQGVVLGMLFRRADPRLPVSAMLGSHETNAIVSSAGRHLTKSYWGQYVAFMMPRDSGQFLVLRDPTAQMPCYHLRWNGTDIFFSHVEDCLRYVPTQASINWDYVIGYLLADDFVKRDSGLLGIEDIPGGELLTIGAGELKRTMLWDPLTFCRENVIEDVTEARQVLRSEVEATIGALASRFDEIIVSLSGGLDSSIVAGCIGQMKNRPSTTCFNFHLTLGFEDEEIALPGFSKESQAKLRRVAGHADERVYARLVCKRWNFPFAEHERSIRDIDFARLLDAPCTVWPTGYVGMMDLDDAEIAASKEHRANAFFTGMGGDTAFYATFQALGAIDYAFDHPFATNLLREVQNASMLSRESMWRVLRKAVSYGVLRRPIPPVFEPLKREHLLTNEAAAKIHMEDIEHPWMALARKATDVAPGKRNHVFGFAHSCLFYRHEYHRDAVAPSVHALTSQPIVETCLRIPTYVLLAEGVSRGLTRQAFADLLPVEIQQRVVKGSGSPFFQRLARTNMATIRDLLLNGELVRAGILDRAKLETHLIEAEKYPTVSASQMLIYVAAEAWVRQWRAEARRAAA